MTVPERWRPLLHRKDVLILDTETTGMRSADEIVEITVIDTCGNVLLDEQVLPRCRVHPRAAELHGLTREMLRDLEAPDYSEIHSDLVHVLDKAAFVVCYNAEFDKRLLAQTAKKRGLDIPPVRWVCAMKDYAEHAGVIHARTGEWRWHKLKDAVRMEAAQQPESHRSQADTYAVLALMEAVVASEQPMSPLRATAGMMSPEWTTGCAGFLLVALGAAMLRCAG